MKALLVTLGSHGDIHPFVDIARALAACNVETLLATNPYYERQIAAAGVPFAAFTEFLDLKEIIESDDVMHPTRGPLTVLRRLTLPHVADFVRRLRELIREFRPDVLVYHPIVLGAPWAAQLEGGVPTVSISPSPLLWANPHDALVLLPFRSHAPHPYVVRFDRWMSRTVLRFALDPGLNRVRRQLGLAPAKHQLAAASCNADMNLGIWSPVLRPPLEGDPPNSFVTGFTWHDRDHTQETPDHELSAFLDAGPPPILFALGSTGVHAAGDFFAGAVDAALALKARALLVVGRGQKPPANLPADGSITSVAYAPFSAVFPRASVVVHHGGAGTMAQGLRAGRPTLITPMAHDQFDNAARAKRLGVSDTLRFVKATPERLRGTLDAILRDQSMAERAAGIAPRIAKEDGAAECARRIAGLVTPATRS